MKVRFSDTFISRHDNLTRVCRCPVCGRILAVADVDDQNYCNQCGTEFTIDMEE